MGKPQVFVVKGSTPWYNRNWKDVSHVISIDESIPGQATITCDGDVTNMKYMFWQCFNITSIDLSRFDTSKVVDMGSIFRECSSLMSLNLSNLDTSKVKNMDHMFHSCYDLTTLDLSNFDTSNVENMNEMFNYCRSLTTVKGTIDMKSCIKYKYMIDKCPKLTNLMIKNPPSDFEGKTGASKSQYAIVS